MESLVNGSRDDAALRGIAVLDRLDFQARNKLSEGEHLRRARIYQFNRAFVEARNHWLEIIKHRGIRCQADVRHAVYSMSTFDCYSTESFDYLSGPVNQYVHRIWMSYASRLD